MKLLKKHRKKAAAAQIPRHDTSEPLVDGYNIETRKILNLLTYTKNNAAAYDGAKYNIGYHSINIDGQFFKGQRNPKQRFLNVNYDFRDKVVLDIGCNQGGMLFEIEDKIKHGIGIDYDSRMINAANRIRAHRKLSHLDFYTFDLANERLEFINDFVKENPVDICFLLSVCMWLDNWQAVIDFTHTLSETLLFESNGKLEIQNAQIAYLHQCYASIAVLAETSEDDEHQKRRKLLLCSKGSMNDSERIRL